MVADAVPTPGSSITARLETHCEVRQKARGRLPQSGTDGKVMRSTQNVRLLIIHEGQVLGQHRALRHLPQFLQGQSERHVNLLHLRSF